MTDQNKTPSLRADQAANQATDPGALGWWCDACRNAGMLHCSEVEVCIDNGQMQQLTYAERLKRYTIIREARAHD